MVDIDYLVKLLGVLKGQGISSFSDGQLHLTFGAQPNLQGFTSAPLTTQDHTVNVPINEAELPPDLRTDNINSMDTILNWSGSGDDGEIPLPGTEIPSFNDNAVHPRQELMPTDPP